MIEENVYKDKSILIRIIGCILLCAGVFLAVIGPLEIICFPMFWAGGRFHYEGFGFGSFMYGVIAAQIIIYPVIGAVLLPLGWGHIRLRKWSGRLSVSLLWAWLAACAPVMAAAAFIAAGTKDMTPASAVITIASLALIWPLLPILFIRFYGGKNAVKTFESRDSKTYLTDRLPVPVLALGAAALMLMLLVSTVVTYSLNSYPDILLALSFPKTESDILAKLPLQGYHLALLMSFPYVGGVIAAVISGKHLRRSI